MRRYGRAATAATLVMLVGCGSLSGPKLAMPGNDGGFGLTVRDVGAGQSYLFGAMPRCVVGDAWISVRVEDVRPADPVGGLSIRSFAVRKHVVGAGDSSGYLGSEPGAMPVEWDADEAVSLPCPKDLSREVDRLYELVIEAHKPGQDAASTSGLVVTYRSEGDRKEMSIPFDLVLCGGAVDSEGRCDATAGGDTPATPATE